MDNPPLNKFLFPVAVLLVIAGLYLTKLYSYVLFHSLAEMFSIVIAGSIFVLSWNSRRYADNNYFLFIGVAFLYIGAVDLVHTLAYKGMGVFPGHDSNLPTQLWIAARYLQALSFLIAPFFLERKIRTTYLFIGYTAVVTILFLSLFSWKVFPVCFVEGAGLTSFKIFSEYFISLLLIASVLLLLKKKEKIDTEIRRLIIASILTTVAAEMSFTLYQDVYGFSNAFGHILKIVAFFFIYRAIIETGLERPFNLLFRDLQRQQEQLQRTIQELQSLSMADPLTGLKNRRGFITLAEQQLKAANRMKRELMFTFIDVDGLKEINDTLGHEEGDRALTDTANILLQTFRQSDIIARVGGDEFTVLAMDMPDMNPDVLSKRLQQAIEEWNRKGSRPYRLAISWGTTTYDPENPVSLDQLLSSADELMYCQKKAKGSR